MLFEKQIKAAFRAKVHTRADDRGIVRYFSPEDFDGLSVTPYSFSAHEGHTLQGYFYSCGEPRIQNRIVIFEHGMGGGHRSYLREIEMLARHGFLVFAYDHTGCMTSEGEETGGFLQSLSDLDAALNVLKKEYGSDGMRFSVVGHSWGGFAALNIPALHRDISHVVAMAGFRSLEAIVKSSLKGPLALYRRAIIEMEKEKHPELSEYDAVSSLCDTEAKVLIIHSEDDKTVPARDHFDVMERALSHRESIRFLRVTGRGHNPCYTEDAAAYLAAFFEKLKARIKAGGLNNREEHNAFLDGFDWHRMTAQDEAVWHEIFRHLEA